MRPARSVYHRYYKDSRNLSHGAGSFFQGIEGHRGLMGAWVYGKSRRCCVSFFGHFSIEFDDCLVMLWFFCMVCGGVGCFFPWRVEVQRGVLDL